VQYAGKPAAAAAAGVAAAGGLLAAATVREVPLELVQVRCGCCSLAAAAASAPHVVRN
jgi:hypothetical protein